MKLQMLKETFGVKELPNGLFYKFPWGLRFNLSDVETDSGTSHLERFLDSLDRTKTIAHSCLKNSENLTILFARYGPKQPVPAMNRAVNQLEEIGFDGARLSYLGAVKQSDDEYEDWRYRHWYSCNLINEPKEIDKLLWNCVAEDMGIEPFSEWGDIYIADLQNRMIVHCYDDRGMDVVAMDKQVIAPFYKKFNEWLLDYDREAIDKKFA